MKIFLPFALALISLGPKTVTAECYTQEGSQHCADRRSAYDSVNNYCITNFNADASGSYKTYTYRTGNVIISHIGRWDNVYECMSAGYSILGECYGLKDGGGWTGNGKSFNILYCNLK
ncbi:hypothetical protein EMCG_08196 [[Emmonsia] crescens]|uniref:Cyanovirin-N domain-containing protein n=1 Tax=[Emmonsia] crescens TaxID=73230 RepID=A0A0G2JAN2_9EURO|nr:hypothetical protein EMCG_08196 [Emmonsia crescens UAMH 3008]